MADLDGCKFLSSFVIFNRIIFLSFNSLVQYVVIVFFLRSFKPIWLDPINPVLILSYKSHTFRFGSVITAWHIRAFTFITCLGDRNRTSLKRKKTFIAMFYIT